MTQQFDPITPIVGLAKELSAAVLASTEELVSFQLDHTQAFITRNSKQLRGVLPEAGRLQESDQWPDAMQKLIEGANIMFRDSVVSAIDYQAEILRLLQKQSTETQQVISGSMQEQFAAIDPGQSRSKQTGGKSPAIAQKLVA